jgi:hypothetical protein
MPTRRGQRGTRRTPASRPHAKERLEFSRWGRGRAASDLATRFTVAEVTPIATTPSSAAYDRAAPPARRVPRRSSQSRELFAAFDNRRIGSSRMASASAMASVRGPIHRAELAQCRRPTATPLRACYRPAARRRRHAGPVARIRRHAQDSRSTGRSDWVRSGHLDGSAQSSRSARQPLPSSSPSLPFSAAAHASCRSHASDRVGAATFALTRMGWRRSVGLVLAIVALLPPVVLAWPSEALCRRSCSSCSRSSQPARHAARSAETSRRSKQESPPGPRSGRRSVRSC